MKFAFGMRDLLMTWVVISSMFAGVQPGSSSAAGLRGGQKSPAEPATEGIEYRNTKYGFSFSLPKEWQGYTIVTNEWEASDAQKGVVEHGPMIYIRHPDWTKENPRQDIPIMVFNLRQWASVEQGDFYMSGAAIRPSELGRNRKYAFALPPRFDETDTPGVREVDQILQHEPLHPIWSK